MLVWPERSNPIPLIKAAGVWNAVDSNIIQIASANDVVDEIILCEIYLMDISEIGKFQGFIFTGESGQEKRIASFYFSSETKKESYHIVDGLVQVPPGTRISICIIGNMNQQATMSCYVKYQQVFER